MKATAGDLPIGEGWTYEVKWDGMRALCFVDDGTLRVQSANERDVTVSWPELAGLPDALPAGPALLDGELVATDDAGPAELRPPPAAHAHRRRRPRRPAGPTRCRSPTSCSTSSTSTGTTSSACPLADRRRLLDQVRRAGAAVAHLTRPRRRPGPPRGGRRAGARGGGGQAGRLPYVPGARTRTWLKVKVRRHQEVVVGGWLPGEGNRDGPHRRAARRRARRGRRRRPAALRGARRHRVQGGRAAPARRPAARPWPPTSARSTRRRPGPNWPAAPPGCGRSWWPRWRTASGPATTASATRATSGCASTRTPTRSPATRRRALVIRPRSSHPTAPTVTAASATTRTSPAPGPVVAVDRYRRAPRAARAWRSTGRPPPPCDPADRRSGMFHSRRHRPCSGTSPMSARGSTHA